MQWEHPRGPITRSFPHCPDFVCLETKHTDDFSIPDIYKQGMPCLPILPTQSHISINTFDTCLHVEGKNEMKLRALKESRSKMGCGDSVWKKSHFGTQQHQGIATINTNLAQLFKFGHN